MEIKDARNNIVYERKTPKTELVEKCIEVTSKIVRKYIGGYIEEGLPKL